MSSPYDGISVENWETKTKELIQQHPLDNTEIYEVVVKVWNEIFLSDLTSRKYRIGKDLFPRPQVMGALLHELIPLEFATRYPKIWRREENEREKDLV